MTRPAISNSITQYHIYHSIYCIYCSSISRYILYIYSNNFNLNYQYIQYSLYINIIVVLQYIQYGKGFKVGCNVHRTPLPLPRQVAINSPNKCHAADGAENALAAAG